MAKARRQAANKPHSTPSSGRRRLKVFKTPIGFHDAYVAAPSRKAALEAWGAGTDLFSAGIAELVTVEDEAAKAALAKPGEVVRVRRTGGKEGKGGPRIEAGTARKAKPKSKPRPKPSRAALDRAEAAVAAIETRQAAERAELEKAEEALAKKRRALEGRHATARDKAEAMRQTAEERYRKAMRDWDV